MTRTIALAALALAIAAPGIAHGQARPLAIEDYYTVRDVGAPRFTPDGRSLTFTVGTRIESTNGTRNETWIAPVDGSAPPRLLTPADTMGSASAPRAGLSPDGRWIAAARDMPVTKRPRPTLTPFEQRHEERFQGAQFDWLPFMGDGRPFPLPNRNDPEVNPPQEIFLAEVVVPSEASDLLSKSRQLTSLGLRPTSLDWAKDGSRIVFTADSNDRSERSYGRAELYSVTTDAVVKRLTPNKQYDYSGAKFSPDGRWILSTRGLADDWIIGKKLNHGGATDVVVVSPDGMREVNLTAQWDYLPSQPFWSRDGSFVYFVGGIGGTNHLFRVPVAGGKVEQVTKGNRRIAGLAVDSTQSRIAYTVAVMERPPEIFVANMDGSGERQISRVHDAFTTEVGLGGVERVQFTSADGTPIEGWLWKPPSFRAGGNTSRYPLIVSSHGGPHSADGYAFSFKNHYFAANGYFVLVTNFRSSTGYGEKHLWGTWGAWGTKDGQDVMSGVDHVIAKYPIDKSRVAAIGHSYGGFMTNWLITQYPDRFAAAVPGAGIVNWVSDYGNADIPITKEKEFWGAPWDARARETMIRQSPLTYANRVKAPTLFIVGEIDQRVPYSETQQMYTALKKVGVPSKVIRYANMPHAISGHWNQVHRMLAERSWIDQWTSKPVP